MADRFIDFHVHVNPFHQLKPDVVKTFRRSQPQYNHIVRLSKDPAGLVALLDEEGVEKACLINYVAPDVMGYVPSTSDWICEYAKDHRTRLVPFGGFHPDHARDAKKEVERLLFTLEVGGVKIHGPHSLLAPNAYLDGKKGLRVLYGLCESEGVPVMFHTGTSVFPGARNKFGDPMLVDDVAVDFPKLKIVLAHGGRPLWTETAQFLARRHPNVYLEISSSPPSTLLQLFPKLEQLADKTIFGSDWPGPHVPGMRANADAFARLPLSVEAKAKILRTNARRVLRRR